MFSMLEETVTKSVEKFDWSFFWTVIGTIATLLTIAVSIIAWLLKKYKNSIHDEIKKEFEPLIEQNKKLVDENSRIYLDINTKLQLPSYSLDVIKLTELATEKKIEEITKQRDEAIASKDKELESALQTQLDEINSLKGNVEILRKEKIVAENKLKNVIVRREPVMSYNGIALPTGLILLVRHNGRYGALQAIDQTAEKRGEFIKYAWWYQPDNTLQLLTKNTQFGMGEAFFGQAIALHPGSSPMLNIGPISLFWSTGGEGSGWIYFGPDVNPSPDYELLLTNEFDITKINLGDLVNQFLKGGFQYSVIVQENDDQKIQNFIKKVEEIKNYESSHVSVIDGSQSKYISITVRDKNAKSIIQSLAQEANLNIKSIKEKQ